MRALDEHLTIVSQAERAALYELPDFDDFQRAEYFAVNEAERTLVRQCRGMPEQILCHLQLGYFKAKQAFFSFDWTEVPPEDIDFLRQRYFPNRTWHPHPIRKAQHYAQRHRIVAHFGYRLWSDRFTTKLAQRAAQAALRDVTPSFILTELLAWLQQEKIVRLGYTQLQRVISEALSAERARLGTLLEAALDESAITALQQLLVRDNALSELAALKQDAKDFRYRMMVKERKKRETLDALYRHAKTLLPTLKISQQNRNYYASLVNFYSIYDLRRLKPGQSYLYLLCYVWQRYREINDLLLESLAFQTRQMEGRTKLESHEKLSEAQARRQKEAPKIGRVLLLFVDEEFGDDTPFGIVRRQAYRIIPKDTLRQTGERLLEPSSSAMALRWTAVDKEAGYCRRQLRPLAVALEFSSAQRYSPWLAALRWMRGVFSHQQSLDERPLTEIPEHTIPKRLRSHLLTLENGKATKLHAQRYEFWIYRQIRKRLDAGELHVDDSTQYRAFGDELVPLDQKAAALEQLDIPWLRRPLDAQLDALFAEQHELWMKLERGLRRGTLKHLAFDAATQTLTGRRLKAGIRDEEDPAFYAQLVPGDIADIFRFVNQRCGFLGALTPLQPRYAKKVVNDDSLMAVILAQAMNHGNYAMARTSDIPYHVLEETYKQYLRLATLKAANDSISNTIAQLPIFPFYTFDLEVLYGAVDGQKFESATPTAKARYSRKYFGKGKGVVAYTFLANHAALLSELIGAHQHESHFVFDICYHNTSDIRPTAITGDMHSINRANFAILNWFGLKLAPRFTSLQAQLEHLYCGGDPADYEKFLIRPVGVIDRELIESEKSNIDRIVATLGLKEMTQSTLIRKLCTMSANNRTRKAIFEFDKLIRSIYTLRCLLDPQLQRDVHRSQNRIESYHQLRAYIAQVSGKKELIGRTALEVAISNECGRLLANVIIAYNSMVLSALLDRYQSTGNLKALERFKRMSPVAWQHIHFLGHYLFKERHPIDLETLLVGVKLV